MNGAEEHARTEEANGILTVTIDRDAKLNAISPAVTRVLWESVRALAARSELRAMVITARGRYYTAGIDLKAPTPATVASDGREFRALYREHHLLYDELEAVEKPVVLAAQGPCLGAGLEMACSCDFRFASRAARFQLPEVGLGTIPGSGGTSRLTRLIGPHWAKWMIMAGRSVDADQALAIGLVHEVFEADSFHEQVHERVREIAAHPPQALGVAKLAISMVDEVDRGTARQIERLANAGLIFGDEFKSARRRWQGS